MSIKKIIIAATICTFALLAQSQSLPKKENFHLYLLIGQSNMAGRGKVEPNDTTANPCILSLNKEKVWVFAKEPIGFDKPFAGVRPGLAFAREMSYNDTAVCIGLIPCAHGGSPIASWKTGAYFEPTNSFPLDNAVERAKLAMTVGTLKGIIWNQGESDCIPEKAIVYEKNLEALIDTLRVAFNNPTIPFVAAELPTFQLSQKTNADAFHLINKAYNNLQKSTLYYAVIKSDSTTHKGDSLHYDSKSTRLMGQRYAREMKKMIQK